MFNPNATPPFSHREPMFGWLYQDTINTLKEKTNLDKEIILIITGSGSLANEIVIASSQYDYRLSTEGQFAERLKKAQSIHTKCTFRTSCKSMGVEYETGQSKKNDCSRFHFADCISAFPYYDLPTAEVCTTVTSKQFGAQTGLSLIILQNQNILEGFSEPVDSYLSLRRYYEKGLTNFTPNTPAISALLSFNTTLHQFDLISYKENINNRRSLLETTLNKKGIRHYGTGPVFTIERADIKQEIVDKFNLYTNSGNVQLFLWSNTDKQIMDLLGAL